MKNLLKKTSWFLLGVAALVGVAACTTSKPDDSSKYEPLSIEDYRSYVLNDLASTKASFGTLPADLAAKVEAEYRTGVAAIEDGATVSDVKAAYADAKGAMAAQIPYANGIYSYVSLSNAEKTNILGSLEAYAVRNGITGISLFENGGYVMYNPRITLGTEQYIVGYGFGTLAEGQITADMESESTAAWKRYYHTYNPADPGTANYLNDQGSEVGEFFSPFNTSFFTNFMNETKDGYDWVPDLAKTKPQAVNDADGDGACTTWRFPIRTTADGAKYNTNSAIESRAAYDGRGIEAEDYITPFKLLLTQANGLYRGSELANTKGGSAIVGAKDYYNATKTSADDGDFSKVGVKVYEEDGQWYFEYQFVGEQTQFYAMYYISSSLYAPVPQSFIDLVTVENYLGFNSDKSETPVDNSLSTGQYTLERWDSGQQVVYKKNPYYTFADSKYAIEGLHYKILSAAATDNEAGFKEFLAGNIDSSGIPQTQLDAYKNDERTRQTSGDSNFKLNVNATDAATWEYLWGENGVVKQTPKSEYWEVEPALSNSHFVKALSLAINRDEFADKRGSIASVNYLSSNYMSDPENGISYATTKAHKDAVAGLLANTQNGYNLELAREYFRVALAELEADGTYKPGTKANPKKIELEIAWMYPQHETAYHNEIKQYFETAFNDDSVSGGKYKLEVKFWVGNQWSDVYYAKLMTGQFDLGFGSISGNSLNPLDFMSVLSSDQELSGGFTLNWGTDTNDADADVLVYNGMRWSYDALWTAANGQAIVANGESKPIYSAALVSQEAQEDGSFVETIEMDITLPELTTITVEDIAMCWYEVYNQTGDGNDYNECYASDDEFSFEVSVSEDGKKITIVITVPAELVAEYYGEMGFDVYFSIAFNGAPASESYTSVYGEHPANAN